MARGGRSRREPWTGPQRTCAVTRQRLPRVELVRLVADEHGRVRVDLAGDAPGRGAWVLPDAAALQRLEQEPKLLGRSLRRKRMRTEGLLDQARGAVAERVLLHLQRCRRAGALVSGRHAVEDATDLVAIVLATGAAPPPRAASLPHFRLPLDAADLGRALGRGPRAVVGIHAGRPAAALLRWLQWGAALGYCLA